MALGIDNTASAVRLADAAWHAVFMPCLKRSGWCSYLNAWEQGSHISAEAHALLELGWLPGRKIP